MKAKLVSVFVLFSMLFSELQGLNIDIDLSTNEETQQEIISVEDNVNNESTISNNLTKLLAKNVYVSKNSSAGIDGDIKVDFNLTTGIGTLYLPGGSDTSLLYLSWDDANLTVKKDGVKYKSGTAPIASSGKSITYEISKGMFHGKITIKTDIGSVAVEPMYLVIDETKGSINDMNSDPDHETSCYGSTSFDGKTYSYMSIKGRGQSTWYYQKKPYNITFYKTEDYEKKSNVELISGVKSKKWSLIANYIDPTHLRNKLSQDLALSLGIGLESRYVDLYMNGEYLGLYLLMPKNDYQASDDGYVLDNDNYYSTDDPQFTIDGMEELGIINGNFNRITVKDIGDNAAAAGETVETISKWFNKAWEVLQDTDSDEYQKYFDVDSWAKMYLMYEFSKTYDAYSGSLLMHRDGITEDDLLFAGPAWDYDNCLGRFNAKPITGITIPTQITAEGWYIDSIGLSIDDGPVSILQELGKHESFMRRVSQIFNEYKWAFCEVIDNIDVQQKLISNSADMNLDRWGVLNYNAYIVPANQTIGFGKYQMSYKLTDSIEDYTWNLREYASKRVQWLSDHLSAEIPTGEISGNTQLNKYDTLTLTVQLNSKKQITYSYQWQSSEDGDIWTDIDGANENTYTIQVTDAQNGMQYRCKVESNDNNIVMVHTDAVKTSAISIIGKAQISVSSDHIHSYTSVVVAPKCGETGYTRHTCACGDYYDDEPTEALKHAYEKGFCKYCGIKHPLVKTEKRIEEVKLENGLLRLYMDQIELGEFTFTQVDGGWTISDYDGKYIALDNATLTLSEEPFTWTYENGRFFAYTNASITSLGKKMGIEHTVKAYLTEEYGELDATLVLGDKFHFKKEIEYIIQ